MIFYSLINIRESEGWKSLNLFWYLLRSMWTGVLRGEMKGEAGGDWGSDWRGEIGWVVSEVST